MDTETTRIVLGRIKSGIEAAQDASSAVEAGKDASRTIDNAIQALADARALVDGMTDAQRSRFAKSIRKALGYTYS